MQSAVIVAPVIDASRQKILLSELMFAWKRTPPSELKELSKNILGNFGKVTLRRTKTIFFTLKSLGGGVIDETNCGIRAYQNGRLGSHLLKRSHAAKKFTVNATNNGRALINQLKTDLETNASKTVPELFISTLAFISASGGSDANGGIPDLDLTLGIGAHRSIFTHSIISGAILETGLFTIAEVIGTLYKYLPPNADPIWTTIETNKNRFLIAAAKGASAGISYHLLIDGTLQPGAYHDLPISLPIEAHQGILVVNSGAELLDVKYKEQTFNATAGGSLSSAAKRVGVAAIGVGNSLIRLINPRNDGLMAVLIFYLWIAEHGTLLSQKLNLSNKIKTQLNDEDISILEKYGCWMNGLASGKILPYTDEQFHFKLVGLGTADAMNLFERSWLAYTKAVNSEI